MENKIFINTILANIITILIILISMPLIFISVLTWVLFIGNIGLLLVIAMELKNGYN